MASTGASAGPASTRRQPWSATRGTGSPTPDGLPYIGPHRRYPRHLFALGCGGNGTTFGFLALRLLLEWYGGDRSDDHAPFAFSRW